MYVLCVHPGCKFLPIRHAIRCIRGIQGVTATLTTDAMVWLTHTRPPTPARTTCLRFFFYFTIFAYYLVPILDILPRCSNDMYDDAVQ